MSNLIDLLILLCYDRAMKLSIDIPDVWSGQLRQAAIDAKCKSVQECLRMLIAANLGVSNAPKTWGGRRDKQSSESKQHTRLTRPSLIDPSHPTIKIDGVDVPVVVEFSQELSYEDIED